MKIIIGLGNPGKEYEKTRHNIGFAVVDLLQKDFEFEDFKEEKKFSALLTSGQWNEEKIVLVKPLTYMNLSGEAVQKIAQFYKISPEACLVIYDDLDLPLGTLRLRKFGSPGTHNGMKSIVAKFGENIPRLRIGIESRGETSPVEQETTNFVLEKFNASELKTLKKSLETSLKAVKTVLKEGLAEGMNRYNTDKNQNEA